MKTTNTTKEAAALANELETLADDLGRLFLRSKKAKIEVRRALSLAIQELYTAADEMAACDTDEATAFVAEDAAEMIKQAQSLLK